MPTNLIEEGEEVNKKEDFDDLPPSKRAEQLERFIGEGVLAAKKNKKRKQEKRASSN